MMITDKFKLGQIVVPSEEFLKWQKDKLDEIYGFPHMYIKFIDEDTYEENLKAYMMWKCIKHLTGIVVGDNTEQWSREEDFAYLVWWSNDYGSEVSYMEPSSLEKE